MINNLFTFVRTLGNQRIEGKKFFTGQVGILGSLSDSSGSLGTAGKVLSTTGSGVQWITVGSSNVQSLNDLSDVIITTPATGQLLRFNGTNWVNWTHSFLDSSSTLGDLFNVGSSADGANDGDILRFNEQSGLWVADEFPSFTEVDTLDSVTGRGATTTNSITVGGLSTSGTVTAAVLTTPLIEREGVLTINSEQQVDQGEPNPNLLYVSWMGDNKFVINADGYAIANTGYKVVGGTASGFLKANGSIDTSTYLTSYTETQTLDDVTDLGATTTNSITVGGLTSPNLQYNGLLTINADSTGVLQPSQGDPAVPVLNFQWAGSTQGYIDTSGKITFSGFKTPLGTSSGFLKANGTVDTNAYITGLEYINDIGDVNLSSPVAGEILQFDGQEWVNGQLPNFTYASKVQHEVKAGVAITKGQAVYVTSADGTNMIVGLASNASEATSSKTMGLSMQNLAINGHGFVITEGLLDGLNTSTATAGDPVWLGTGGNLIYGLTNKPIAPAHLVFIGIVTRSNANNGEIFVKVQNGFELNEIHDVLISSPSWGQLIRRDIDGLWKNWTPDFITPSSVNTLTNKTIPLGTGIATIVNIDSIDPFIGESDIPLYQDGINKGGTISVDVEGNISISNAGIGYYPGQVNTEGGTRFLITITGNILTGTLAEFNEALTDGSFATEAYVGTAIANLVDSAPTTLNTLNELAAALGDDPNFATTVATAIGTKQNQLNGTGFVKASGTTITYDNSTYLTTESDPVFTGSAAYDITSEQITSWDTAYGWGDHAEVGYLTSFTETDPIFAASAAATITTEQISFWDEAYGWGNHALAGYLTSLPVHNHNDLYYTETESDARFYLATNPSGYQTTSGTVANIASGSTTNLNSAWTADGASIANGFRVYRYNSSALNKPVAADNANWLINIFSHPSDGTASYGHQLAAANTNNIYFRSVSNGTFSDWHKFWSTNDFSSTTVSQWNTAYGWGDHSLEGYITSESDPFFTSSPAALITNEQIASWDEAYGWGNHADYGYLTSYTETDTLATVTARGATTNGNIVINGEATIQNDGYLRLIAGSSQISGFTVFNEAQNGYLSNRITTGDHERGWGWEFTTNEANNDAGGVYFRVGYNGAVSYLNSGNFGIGTTSPMGPLEVYKANTGGLGGHIILNNNGQAVGNETAILFNDSGVGSVGSVRAAISSSVENSPYYGDLKFKTGAASYGSLNTRMIITGAGNVGIGTTSPATKLDVNGVITATGGTSTNWNTAYGWGDHATAGYLTAEADTLATVTTRGNSTVNGISVGSLSVPSYIYFNNGGAATFISESWGINLNGQSTQPVQVRGASLGVGYTLGGGTAYGTNNLFVAGNIGVGTYTPTYKLHVAGNAYINETLYVNQHTTIEDNLSVTNGINQNNLIGRPSNAWGASGTTTGAVVIEFPGGSGNYGMIHAVIDIYEYNSNNVCTIIIGGHNWASRWYSYGANVIGSTNKDVRLGFKDGKYCIMIGRADSSWSYGQVVLRKIQNGSYYQGVMSVYDGYDIYQTTDDSTDWITGDLRGLVVPGAISANGGNSNNWNTAYGWGNHATAGYLTVEADTLATVTSRGNSTTGNITVNGITTISKDLGTNDYANIGQHNMQLRIRKVSLDSGCAPRALELGVLDNGTGIIQANHCGIGYNTLSLNPVAGSVLINGNTAWHAGNDGASSGLDADLLDGNHASAFALASHTHSYLPLTGGSLSGSLYMGNNDINEVNSLYFNDPGVGEGVNWSGGSGWGIFECPDVFDNTGGNLQFALNASERLMTLDVSGNLWVAGTYTEASSIRFKENIKTLEPTLYKVEQLNPVTYNKIGVEQEEIGLIAEEIAELFPEVVTYNEDGQPQGVQYQRLSVILLKAVQELTERVNKLENK